MSSPGFWALPLLAGLLLGVLFFVSLWRVTLRAVASNSPGRWILLSLPVRMSLAAGGIFAVVHRDAWRLLPCLLGFLAARSVVLNLTRPVLPRS